MESIQAVKGMNDILPGQIEWWQKVERIARQVLEDFGYREIRTPALEKLELFSRGIGESTDIVEKEMYVLEDSKGEKLALRPEATASVVRSFIQHKLHADPLMQKFYAIGPMFRHERPQKGRYRQFHQIDVEAFGIDDPMLDAEVMYMLRIFLERVGLTGVVLHINSLGCPECRKAYRKVLQDYLERYADALCPDCQRRRHTNPLRTFDCKVERCKELLEGAPMLLESICSECAEHFERVKSYLKDLDTPFVINPRMVRGLDYYMRTTFEVITDRLGAQNAVGGGGRYNGLVKDLGGPDLPGIGFAIGMERLILLLQQESEEQRRSPQVFVAALGEAARQRAFLLTQQLRNAGLETEMDYEGRSLKSQMRRADKLSARHVLILGEEELARGEIQLRDMMEKSQRNLPLETAAEVLKGICGGK
ncbi:histidine--tRNA ligase [Desulforhabdus amnigena]|jgi:histidyl-tRNA synthetase|uniref:Histidine--tRNA ligase n=1 Tax=Desulforhabdus amnigena TaxID=40218 RepID=A0A9W6FX36_9BACT|nr:histidine--tRNA ligase [Desulforhabdus amnigena]NLJ27120.1 histidine--tRNA ligase [Deltaproteobacteria bacterium]GLI36407.1 histidine--tRNA ligase [Desulforhabdus amnigena]